MGLRPLFRALKCANRSIREIDLFELNEAFAATSIAVIRDLVGIVPSLVLLVLL